MYPKNCDELIARMLEIAGKERFNKAKQKGEEDRDVAMWFVAMQQAAAMAEYTTKDLAGVILRGMDPLTIKGIDEWLAQQVEGAVSEDEEQTTVNLEDLDEQLDDSIKMHFGVNSLLDHSKDGPDEG